MTGHKPDFAWVTQTILLADENEALGVYGNCMQAAIASIVGRPLEAVPHFGAFTWWPGALRLWLRGVGLDYTHVAAPPIPQERAMLVGGSPRGNVGHAVVSEHGEIIWDPHPTRAGLADIKGAYVIHAWATDAEEHWIDLDLRGVGALCTKCHPGRPARREPDPVEVAVRASMREAAQRALREPRNRDAKGSDQ